MKVTRSSPVSPCAQSARDLLGILGSLIDINTMASFDSTLQIRIASICAVLLLFISPSGGKERVAPKKLKEGASCVTKECHAKQIVGPVVHQPVAKQKCDACHDQEDPEEGPEPGQHAKEVGELALLLEHDEVVEEDEQSCQQEKNGCYCHTGSRFENCGGGLVPSRMLLVYVPSFRIPVYKDLALGAAASTASGPPFPGPTLNSIEQRKDIY